MNVFRIGFFVIVFISNYPNYLFPFASGSLQRHSAAIKNLLEKGLISHSDRSNKTIFIAEKPQKILDILNDRKTKLENLEKTFAQIMPDLDAIYNLKTDKPRVRFLEGREGMEILRNEIIRENPKLVCNIITDAIFNLDPKKFEDENKSTEKSREKLFNSVEKYKILVMSEKNQPHVKYFQKAKSLLVMRYVI